MANSDPKGVKYKDSILKLINQTGFYIYFFYFYYFRDCQLWLKKLPALNKLKVLKSLKSQSIKWNQKNDSIIF